MTAFMSLAPMAQAQSFREVPTLGGGFSQAHGVGNSGLAAGAADTPASAERAVRNALDGTNLNLMTLGGGFSYTGDISQDGLVVVGGSQNSQGRLRAFRWTSGTGMQDIGILTGGQTAFGIGTNGDGSVVVGWATNSSAQLQPFRWTQATGVVNLGTFGGTQGHSLGVSLDGSTVVGFARDAGGSNRPFRWTESLGLVDLGGASGQAAAANLDGTVIVGTSGSQAFRWTEAAGLVGLTGLPGLFGSDSLDVTADGMTIVGRAQLDAGSRAFLWTESAGMQNLNALFAGTIPAGWVLQRAESISADGRYVAGVGTDALGRERGWVLDTIPAPGAAPLLALLGAAAGRRRRT